MREYKATLTERIWCEHCQKLYASSDGSGCPFCSGEAIPAEEELGNKGSDFFGSGPGFTLTDIEKQSNQARQDDTQDDTQDEKQTAKTAKAAAKENSKKKEADSK